jgi:imidazolonepropionase-like amidohydrolase
VHAAAGSSIQAVRSATTIAAEALGMTGRGAIEPGMLADIIAVRGDRLQDGRVCEQVRFVMVGGTVMMQRRE